MMAIFSSRIRGTTSRPRPVSPRVERLEDRTVPTTFTVTTTADGGPGSLRQAILDANATPGADAITVPAGYYALTQGELDITDDVTITGAQGVGNTPVAGAPGGLTVIDAAGLSRIFAMSGVNVNLAWLTIQNGQAAQGGGVLNQGGNLTLAHCTLNANEAVQSASQGDALGGGIYSVGGSVSVSHCTFFGEGAFVTNTSNYAGTAGGGDLFASGSILAIADSAFAANTLIGNYVQGGAVAAVQSTVNVARSSFACEYLHAMTASRLPLLVGGAAQGGDIYLLDGTLTMAGTSLEGSLLQGGFGQVRGGDAQGGGIYALGSSVTLANDSVSDMILLGGYGSMGPGGDAQGGGICLVNGILDVTNSNFTDNSVQGSLGDAGFGDAQGGGIYVNIGTVRVTKSSFTQNSAFSGQGDSQGGGIYAAAADVQVANSTFSLDQATSNGGTGQGGGIYVEAGTLTILHDSFSNNFAATSGNDLYQF